MRHWRAQRIIESVLLERAGFPACLPNPLLLTLLFGFQFSPACPLSKVALEEEGFEQQAVAAAAAAATLTASGTRAAGRAGRGRGPVAGGSSGWVWWWGRGRRVSRERLVEEALELTFRLIMSGDVALDALKVKVTCVSSKVVVSCHGVKSRRKQEARHVPSAPKASRFR